MKSIAENVRLAHRGVVPVALSDPHLILVGRHKPEVYGRDHFLYQEDRLRTASDPVLRADLYADMAAVGFRKEYPLGVWRDGDDFLIWDGRGRYTTLHRVATDQGTLGTAEEPVVYVVVTPGTEAEIYDLMTYTSESRVPRDPIARARAWQVSLTRYGRTAEEVVAKTTLGGVAALEDHLRLLSMLPRLQALTAAGRLALGVALEVARRPQAEQQAALAEMEATGQITRATARAGIQRAKDPAAEVPARLPRRQIEKVIARHCTGAHPIAGASDDFIRGAKWAAGLIGSAKIAGMTAALAAIPTRARKK